MAVFFYFYSYQVVQRQADVSNINLITTLKESCDRELEHYENALLQLALDKTIQQLSNVHGDFTNENYYELYSLNRKIMDMQIAINQSGNFCNDITVYFKNNGKLVSTRGNMDLESYCGLYCFEDAESIEWLRNYFSEYHVWRAARPKGKLKDGSSPLLLTMTNMQGDFGETTAMIGLWIDMDALAGSLKLESGENEMDWLLISEEDQIMSRPGEFEDMGIFYSGLGEESDGELEYEGEKYILRTALSEVFDWKYVLLMPESRIGSSAKKLRNFFALCLLICLGTGFVAAGKMTQKSYNPIKALLDMFRKYDKENRQVDNEYVYLSEKAMALFEEHSEFQQKIRQSREVVRHYYLIDLLINPFGGQEKYTPERAEVCNKFEQGSNRVLLLKIREEKKPEEDADRNNLQKFIVGNVFGEGIGEAFEIEIAELGDAIALLMNIPQSVPGMEEKMMEIIDSLQKFIFDHFEFRVAVLAGENHKGLGGVHLSYREARESEAFLHLLDSDFISYHEIRDASNRNYEYSMAQEERIITAIRNNDSQLAVSCINGVLDVNFQQLKASPAMRRCLLYDLMGTLIKAAQELGVKPGEILNTSDISTNMSYQEARERFALTVEEMCCQEDTNTEGDCNSQLCEEVDRYVQENFGDPDMNVSRIGQHFHITPAYLSSIYKKQTGESLLRVLNQTRIEAAERFLAEGVSVVETAERAGFRDSSTFIRAFKKATGTTPGQLKNNRRYG